MTGGGGGGAFLTGKSAANALHEAVTKNAATLDLQTSFITLVPFRRVHVYRRLYTIFKESQKSRGRKMAVNTNDLTCRNAGTSENKQ